MTEEGILQEGDVDVLQEVPDDEICEVLSLVEQRWPNYFVLQQTIEMIIEDKKTNSNTQTCLYAPQGNVGEGIFFTLQRSHVLMCVLDHNVTGKVSQLIGCLLQTKRILWKEHKTTYIILPEVVIPVLSKSLEEVGLHCEVFRNLLYWLPPHARNLSDGILPPDVFLDFLSERHVPELNDSWSYRFPGSEVLLTNWISGCFGMGLFRKTDNKLLCSSISNYTGGIFNLHTEVAMRGKGYASIIVTAMSKEIMKRGRIPFGIVGLGNIPSQILFSKLKFEILKKECFISVTS